MIAYFASDLLWATRIKDCAQDLGIEARPVRTIEMLEARLGDSPVRGLVVDLDQAEMASELIRRVRLEKSAAGSRPIRVVAFGPHVETEALAEAGRLGADKVMTRGAFHSRLPEALRWMDEQQLA